ncbi:MAG: hypothetical protein JWM40_2390 [Frankiales bacterium]|nr:hypothetical protein [Frankiales bacterium]
MTTLGTNTRNRLLIPLAAVLVAALIATLTWALSSRSPHSPRVLKLLGTGGTASTEAAPMAAGAPADSRSSAASPYKLSGPLPEGRPSDAPAYALDGPWSTDRLAEVLDRRGLTTEHASWWWSTPCSVQPASGAVEQGKPTIEPTPGGEVCAYSGDGTSSSSGSATTDPAPPCCKTEPAPEPTTPAMTASQARAAAAPVFDALDLPIEDATVTVSPWGGSVWLDPVVHGLPTSGYTTRVELGQDRKISYASGFLGDLTKGDTYPLITAREAFDQIETPPMMDMICRVGPNGQGCEPPPPQEITGAKLGLTLRQTGKGDQLLVPAWLFTVKGWTDPLGQIAVDKKYLGEAEPDDAVVNPTDKGTAPATDPGSGSSSGSAGTDGSGPTPVRMPPSPTVVPPTG